MLSLGWARWVKEVDEEKNREDEPLEEADAADCNASAFETEFSGEERGGDASESQYDWREELHDAFAPEPMVMVPHPVDGLPVPAGEMSDLSLALPFSIDSVVCLEDNRKYVELFSEELVACGWVRDPSWKNFPLLPSLSASSRASDFCVRSRWNEEGCENERLQYDPNVVERRFGKLVAVCQRGFVPVRPIRERCAHYGRMVMGNQAKPDPSEFGHQIIFRNCSARRSVGGAYMTVSNEAVYACDYRKPADPSSSEKYLDGPDRKRLASEPELVPLFGGIFAR